MSRAHPDWQLEVVPIVIDADTLPPRGSEKEPSAPRTSTSSEPVLTPEQIVEAALFVGGPPLTAEKLQSAVRVPPEVFLAAVDSLNRKYKNQRRPYCVQHKDGGYILVVRPQFRGLRDKLFGGPREARLSQQALDVLSLIAYRQPIEKSEIDTLRGYDSGSILRQLIRLGLVNVHRRGESGNSEVAYGTTPRFLDLFHLADLDDLPRLGESEVS